MRIGLSAGGTFDLAQEASSVAAAIGPVGGDRCASRDRTRSLLRSLL